ncbi:hypothetical protein HMPREF0666_02700 [Prevotella sp. C561]|uniref:hypothetical protein n=1 Tax=Prevotella sp. C561 TaxID=563031 RepID=UPI00022374F3|nr:hypothetical protein [Prevotella sp. C561]EGW49480.1 hypothetical protein HMPREF0666_02700 [Prevotella sp. C561]
MKNYLKPYTMCTRVESEGYLLAGTGGGRNGQIRAGNPGGGSGSAENNKSNAQPMSSENNTTLSKDFFFESEE